jgi:putative transposase
MPTQTVQRSYRYRCYPSASQQALLQRTFGCVRLVYNRALQARVDAYHREGRTITYVQSSAMLTEWKTQSDLSFLNEVSSVPLQQALRHLQVSFVNFWEGRSKFPTFKSRKKGVQAAEFTSSAFRWRKGQLYLAKMREPLDIRWSRPLPPGAVPKTVTVTKDASGRWFVSLPVESVVESLPEAASIVGIDAGVASLVTLSTGEKITNPKFEQRDRRRLRAAQKSVERKQLGSANRAKARTRAAKVHARIADRRRDHLHKLSTRIIRENQAVVIEDLHVRGMVRNHRLARAISDASWAELRHMLEYKADWYGRTVVTVDRFYPSSKICSDCGRLADSLPLNIRFWTCPCGSVHDRDVNAARNIRAAGLADLNACGGAVRPEPRTRGRHASAKQEPQRATAGLL